MLPVPPRGPPFGKGELRNKPTHLPGSAHSQGNASADRSKGDLKKSARSSAAKKDNTKGVAKPDSAPKTDAD